MSMLCWRFKPRQHGTVKSNRPVESAARGDAFTRGLIGGMIRTMPDRPTIGPDLDRSYHLDRSYYRASGHPRPHIQFRWTGGDRFIRWITASDLVALSLLLARLMDLGKPIKVVEGDWCGDTVRSRSDHSQGARD